uniref:Uncharacterized protein n=1 Tax=Arundo donax TaxID=35708 RepID=A0A0A8YQV1_ARUDO
MALVWGYFSCWTCHWNVLEVGSMFRIFSWLEI